MRSKISAPGVFGNKIVGVFVLGCAIIASTSEYKKQYSWVLFAVMAIFLIVFLAGLFRVVNISWEDDKLYIKRMFYKEEEIPFQNIVKIKRVLSKFIDSSNLKFGYKLDYINNEGKSKSCDFYIALGNSLPFQRMTNKLAEVNPSVEIIE